MDLVFIKTFYNGHFWLIKVKISIFHHEILVLPHIYVFNLICLYTVMTVYYSVHYLIICRLYFTVTNQQNI